jgi:hypothetical protein
MDSGSSITLAAVQTGLTGAMSTDRLAIFP